MVASAPAADPSASQSVLVIDDAADVRQLAQASLATSGYSVLEASGGTEALEVASRERPACVVVDVNMPDMNGFDVCRALRADPATSSVTIVMLTSADTAEDKIAAYLAGADDYITKPFAPRDLVSRVRHAMTRHLPPPGP